jgi:hypothetical protein
VLLPHVELLVLFECVLRLVSCRKMRRLYKFMNSNSINLRNYISVVNADRRKSGRRKSNTACTKNWNAILLL